MACILKRANQAVFDSEPIEPENAVEESRVESSFLLIHHRALAVARSFLRQIM